MKLMKLFVCIGLLPSYLLGKGVPTIDLEVVLLRVRADLSHRPSRHPVRRYGRPVPPASPEANEEAFVLFFRPPPTTRCWPVGDNGRGRHSQEQKAEGTGAVWWHCTPGGASCGMRRLKS